MKLNIIQETSENCLNCGLFSKCKNPFLRPIIDYRSETKNTNTLLIVADWTDTEDDEKDGYFNSNARGYKAVEAICKSLDCKYVFTTALACGLTEDSKSEKLKKNFSLCFREKLKPLILKHKPRAIVCLGKQAMDAVLQDKAPKTMKEILKTGMNVEWQEELDETLNTLVLAVDHPVRFFNEKVDRARLEGLYKLVFSKAEKFCLETEVRKPVEYELVTSPARFYQIAGMPFKEMAFDVENRHSKKDLLRNTIWKPNSELLSLAFTFYDEKSKVYRNFVVVGQALFDKLCVEKLFIGRKVVGHNSKHDCQVIWNRLKIDIFSLIESFDDTLALFYLTDQNRINNGLKDLSAQYLGIYDYADEVKRYEIEANQRLKQFRTAAIANLKEKQLKLKDYTEALNWKNTGNKITAIKAKRLQAVLDEFSSLEEIEDLVLLCREKVEELPPEGSSDYGDLPIAILAQYNAEDTYCTLKLKREILPYLSKYDRKEGEADPLWDPVAYDLFRKSVKMICYVERNGLPMDMDSLQDMKKELEETELKVRKDLLKRADVLEALYSLKNIQDKVSKERCTEEDLLNEVSPTKAKFITTLCQNLKLNKFALLTKGNNWSFTSKKCINNIRDHFNPENGNGDESIYNLFNAFSYVGNNRQVRSKFINNWEQYYSYDDKCFHPNFVLTKNQSLLYANQQADGGAQSGRLGSTQINSQQIRKVGYLRKHFKAPPGYVFLEVDYSSLEPVLISMVSGCERLKNFFRRKLDIYRVTANDIYDFGVDLNLPDAQVRKELKKNVDEVFRDKLKIGFLAWCYGRGIYTFARDMKITEDEAREFYDKARQMYSEIYDWKETIVQTIEEGRQIHTLFGRKRSFPVLQANKYDREDWKRFKKDLSKAIRIGVNFPIQSLGSDICLWQAAGIQDWIMDENLGEVIKMVNLVHDAIWFLVKESQLDWAVKEIQTRMEDTSKLPFGVDVPLRTEADYGPTLASYLKKNKDLTLPCNLGAM